MINTATLSDNLISLKREIDILRSFVIGLAGKDRSGQYKAEFVNRILKTSQEKNIGEFTDKEDFLKKIM